MDRLSNQEQSFGLAYVSLKYERSDHSDILLPNSKNFWQQIVLILSDIESTNYLFTYLLAQKLHQKILFIHIRQKKFSILYILRNEKVK